MSAARGPRATARSAWPPRRRAARQTPPPRADRTRARALLLRAPRARHARSDRPALDQAPPAEIERGLNRASDGELLEPLNAVPDSVESVLLIGHNPALQQLALSLADSGAERARVERKYPTGAMAALTFNGRWSELGPGGAELARPKTLG